MDSNTYMVIVMAEAGGEMATQDVTVTVTNVEEPGTVTLMPMAPSVDTEITADLTDEDIVTPNHRRVAVVQVHGSWTEPLHGHRHGNLDDLHPGGS